MHVDPKPVGAYPWFVRLFFAQQRRKYGRVLDPGLLWGRSKWVFATLALLYGALDRRRSPLDPALRSLVTVRVSQINHCAFCVDVNSATLMRRGVDEAKVAVLAQWRGDPQFTAAERAALDYAETVTITGRKTQPDQFTALRAHFDEDGIVELTALIAFQNMSSKFNAALDVPPQGFCRLPAPSSSQDRNQPPSPSP